MTFRLDWSRLAGMLLVAALHGAALWALWQHRLLPTPDRVATLFVNFIASPSPATRSEPRPAPVPAPPEKPQPRQIVAEPPMPMAADQVAPPPPSQAPPAMAPAARPMPLPAGPVTLGAELSVACPERGSPAYPMSSRRMGETGTVVLQVELDEHGHVVAARVGTSSGHGRLDDAALNAVRTWRCTPATRNGQPVRAVAQQAFNFVLQGN